MRILWLVSAGAAPALRATPRLERRASLTHAPTGVNARIHPEPSRGDAHPPSPAAYRPQAAHVDSCRIVRMPSSILRWGVIPAILIATTPQSWAEGETGTAPVPADAVGEAHSVEEALNGLRGLVASFTQTVESAGLPRPQLEKGTVYLMRPGRMRWEYDVPRGKLAIADGRKSWVYLPEERQVLVAPLDEEGSRSGIAILLQRVDLVGSFEISWGGGNERGARPLLLKPRAPRPEYDHLLLTPGPDHLVR